MKIRLLALALALAAALPSVKAQTFLEVVNGSAAGVTNASTQIVGPGVNYAVGKLRLALDSNQRAAISYTFEGAEASLRNQFFGPGGSSMIDTMASVGTMLTTRVDAGLLDFSFQSPGVAATTNRNNYAWNDSNIGIVLNSDRLSGLLLFEDGRSRLGSDHDYDDMVVRFNVSVMPVPEPDSIAMLLAGLGAMELLRRRARHG